MNDRPTSQLTEGLSIRLLTSRDVPDVLALCSAVSLQWVCDVASGFLVSSYNEEVYLNALAHTTATDSGPCAMISGAFDPQGGLAGFVFGYDASYGRAFMGGVTEAVIDDDLGRSRDYYILKQIVVAAAWRRRGIGQMLANAFLNAACPERSVFLTIVSEPANPASEQFHAKLGFRPVLPSISRGAGRTYPARIWHREAERTGIGSS
jgi:GNAT superfamily N-acetyltransferase